MEFAEQLKSSVDIVRVVGEYVRLKRSGAGPRYVGLCPFHTEKTGSFSVHSSHQFYKCFGCGAGGDVIKFIMEIERLTFWEACKHLAERHGIPLPNRTDQADDEARQRGGIFEMHEIAVRLFREQLFSPAGADAREYLKRRGLARSTAEEFSLGLSERGGQSLVRAFEKQGFSHDDMEASGLVLRRNDGTGFYDRFRGRLMFPIHSESGKTIAFGGRALGEGDEPKYLNSSETPVYRKSHVLYNLNRARKAVQEAGFSILVEGYMDVIGVFAAGIHNVVATCGTALTSFQVHSLRRHAPEIVVNFDPDAAGANATEKWINDSFIPALLPDDRQRLKLGIIQLSDGLDPDEFIKTHGVEAYRSALVQRRYYWHWLADRARARVNRNTPDGAVAVWQTLLPAIQNMPDTIMRLAVVDDLATYMKMEKSVVLNEVRRLVSGRGSRETKREEPRPDPNEVLLLHALLGSPEARAEIVPVLRQSGITERFAAREIFHAILRIIDAGEIPSYSTVEARLTEPEKERLAALVFTDDTLSRDFTVEQAVACIRKLSSGQRDFQRNELREKIRDAERAGDLNTALRLMRDLGELERS